MNKKKKLLSALAAFAFFLIVYLFILSERVGFSEPRPENNKVAQEIQKPVDLVKLEIDYKERMSDIYSNLENLSLEQEGTISADDLSLMRDRALSLTVPKEEYKELHRETILMLDEIISSDPEDYANWSGAIEQIMEENSWLK